MAVLAHGLPTVTTQPQRALPHFVDGENVVYVPAGDAVAVAGAIVRVQLDFVLRQRLQTGARALHDTYDWPAIAAQHVELFRMYESPA
jgi:glycogen(starch) synthase